MALLNPFKVILTTTHGIVILNPRDISGIIPRSPAPASPRTIIYAAGEEFEVADTVANVSEDLVVQGANAPGTFTATASSSEMLAENTNRQAVLIQNTGNQAVFFAFGANAAEINKGFCLTAAPPGAIDRIEFSGELVPREAINCIASSGSQVLLFTEWD